MGLKLLVLLESFLPLAEVVLELLRLVWLEDPGLLRFAFGGVDRVPVVLPCRVEENAVAGSGVDEGGAGIRVLVVDLSLSQEQLCGHVGDAACVGAQRLETLLLQLLSLRSRRGHVGGAHREIGDGGCVVAARCVVDGFERAINQVQHPLRIGWGGAEVIVQ